jgi:hypothetical protein
MNSEWLNWKSTTVGGGWVLSSLEAWWQGNKKGARIAEVGWLIHIPIAVFHNRSRQCQVESSCFIVTCFFLQVSYLDIRKTLDATHDKPISAIGGFICWPEESIGPPIFNQTVLFWIDGEAVSLDGIIQRSGNCRHSTSLRSLQDIRIYPPLRTSYIIHRYERETFPQESPVKKI